MEKPNIEPGIIPGEIAAYISLLECENEALKQTLKDWEILINKERSDNADLIDKIRSIKVEQPGHYLDFVKIGKPGQLNITDKNDAK